MTNNRTQGVNCMTLRAIYCKSMSNQFANMIAEAIHCLYEHDTCCDIVHFSAALYSGECRRTLSTHVCSIPGVGSYSTLFQANSRMVKQ